MAEVMQNTFEGEELTANYFDTPDYIKKPSPEFIEC